MQNGYMLPLKPHGSSILVCFFYLITAFYLIRTTRSWKFKIPTPHPRVVLTDVVKEKKRDLRAMWFFFFVPKYKGAIYYCNDTECATSQIILQENGRLMSFDTKVVDLYQFSLLVTNIWGGGDLIPLSHWWMIREAYAPSTPPWNGPFPLDHFPLKILRVLYMILAIIPIHTKTLS